MIHCQLQASEHRATIAAVANNYELISLSSSSTSSLLSSLSTVNEHEQTTTIAPTTSEQLYNLIDDSDLIGCQPDELFIANQQQYYEQQQKQTLRIELSPLYVEGFQSASASATSTSPPPQSSASSTSGASSCYNGSSPSATIRQLGATSQENNDFSDQVCQQDLDRAQKQKQTTNTMKISHSDSLISELQASLIDNQHERLSNMFDGNDDHELAASAVVDSNNRYQDTTDIQQHHHHNSMTQELYNDTSQQEQQQQQQQHQRHQECQEDVNWGGHHQHQHHHHQQHQQDNLFDIDRDNCYERQEQQHECSEQIGSIEKSGANLEELVAQHEQVSTSNCSRSTIPITPDYAIDAIDNKSIGVTERSKSDHQQTQSTTTSDCNNNNNNQLCHDTIVGHNQTTMTTYAALVPSLVETTQDQRRERIGGITSDVAEFEFYTSSHNQQRYTGFNGTNSNSNSIKSDANNYDNRRQYENMAEYGEAHETVRPRSSHNELIVSSSSLSSSSSSSSSSVSSVSSVSVSSPPSSALSSQHLIGSYVMNCNEQQEQQQQQQPQHNQSHQSSPLITAAKVGELSSTTNSGSTSRQNVPNHIEYQFYSSTASQHHGRHHDRQHQHQQQQNLFNLSSNYVDIRTINNGQQQQQQQQQQKPFQDTYYSNYNNNNNNNNNNCDLQHRGQSQVCIETNGNCYDLDSQKDLTKSHNGQHLQQQHHYLQNNHLSSQTDYVQDAPESHGQHQYQSAYNDYHGDNHNNYHEQQQQQQSHSQHRHQQQLTGSLPFQQHQHQHQHQLPPQPPITTSEGYYSNQQQQVTASSTTTLATNMAACNNSGNSDNKTESHNSALMNCGATNGGRLLIGACGGGGGGGGGQLVQKGTKANPTPRAKVHLSEQRGLRGRPRKKKGAAKGKVSGKLWEFIRDLLLNECTNPSFIRWERREDGVFKFVQSDKVAKMWGERKQNPKMTYEKLSRAMRYYYKSKVLLPVFGRRLVYKFGPNATGWMSVQQQQQHQQHHQHQQHQLHQDPDSNQHNRHYHQELSQQQQQQQLATTTLVDMNDMIATNNHQPTATTATTATIVEHSEDGLVGGYY